MAGHSKWANIKHRKGRADAAKGKVFSRVIKELISAVKQGGPDPKSNSKLKLVLQKARAANVPNDNIERNIKKAASADQAEYFEITYELYGHGGVGILIEAMTDNKNRTASDIRGIVGKKGGSIAAPGAVAFNFDRKGVIQVLKKSIDEDALFNIASDAGAEDFETEEELYMITTPPEKFYQVRDRLEESGAKIEESSLEYIPKTYVECTEEAKKANAELIDKLEQLEDVDVVFHNMQ